MNTNSTTKDDIKRNAKDVAADSADALKSGVQDVTQKVTNEATQYGDQAKDAAADEVKGVASALRTAANEMRSGSPQERTISQIAGGLADVSDSMRDKDLGEMVGTVTDFARRNPLAFLGGAALVGFAASRFAKASSDQTRPSDLYHQSRDQTADTTPAHLPGTSFNNGETS